MKASVISPLIYPIMVPADNSLQSYNFYLIQHEKALFLVDAGNANEACWEHLLRTLNSIGAAINDLDAIILTHNHADHTGLVNRIRAHSDVPVYAHPNARVRLKRDRGFLEERAAFFEQLYLKMGCGQKAYDEARRLRRAIEDNQSQKIAEDIATLKEGEAIYGFQVFEIIGHSPDHIALFHEKSGILLAGDHILADTPTNALVEYDQNGKRTRSLEQYEYSLKKVAHLPLQAIYPGHGAIIRDPQKKITEKLARIDRRAERLIGQLGEPRTPAQLAKRIYRKKYETLFSLVMSEAIGHLDRLETLQKVMKEERDGIYYYVNAE